MEELVTDRHQKPQKERPRDERNDAAGVDPQGKHQPEAQQGVLGEMRQLADKMFGYAEAKTQHCKALVDIFGDKGTFTTGDFAYFGGV